MNVGSSKDIRLRYGLDTAQVRLKWGAGKKDTVFSMNYGGLYYEEK